jgi:DNA primase
MRLSAETVKTGIDPEQYYKAMGVEFKGKANGAGWILALCPLHGDKDPSLSINLKHGGFACFGCGEKGDLIRFHGLMNHMQFNDALADLARRFL